MDILAHEAAIRITAFMSVFAAMAAWERRAPRRTLSVSKALRWTNNLALVILNTTALRLVFAVAATGLAFQASAHGWGLLQQGELPECFRILLGVIILDLAIYFQYVLFHAVPVFWRLHRVHHADLGFDVTTGSRFHPFEIFLSMAIKCAVILAFGPPALAVLIFEVVLNAAAMSNHSNVRIPLAIERVVRWFSVTPGMHRVHHSIQPSETNGNFGFNRSTWDRLFGTYRAAPALGRAGMTIGLEGLRNPREVDRLDGMPCLPCVRSNDAYAINRRTPTPTLNTPA